MGGVQLKCIALLTAILLTGCDNPSAFKGRLILEGESHAQMMADSRCQTAWDVKPVHHAIACSWTFRDAMNPGQLACHIVFEQPGGAAGIVAELSNCAGIDQKVMKS